MKHPARYGVFMGDPQFRPLRLGVVAEKQMAVDLMQRIHTRTGGNYFVVSMASGDVVASVWGEPEHVYTEPTFDIFIGVPDKNAVWFEAVGGLANARDRMEKIAEIQPGRYFVFSRRDHSVVARVDTSVKLRRTAASRRSA